MSKLRSQANLPVQKRFWLVVSGMINLCQERARQGKVLCVVISAEDATWSLVCTETMLADYFWPAIKRTRSYQQWLLYSGFCGECLGRLIFDVLISSAQATWRRMRTQPASQRPLLLGQPARPWRMGMLLQRRPARAQVGTVTSLRTMSVSWTPL